MTFPYQVVVVFLLETVGTVVVSRRHPGAFGFWRLVAAASLAAGSAFTALLLSVHFCDAGVPLTTWLVPSMLVGATIAAARGWPATLLAAAHFACALWFSLVWSAAVHGPDWVGRPGPVPGEAVEGAEVWHTLLTGLYRRIPGEPPAPAQLTTPAVAPARTAVAAAPDEKPRAGLNLDKDPKGLRGITTAGAFYVSWGEKREPEPLPGGCFAPGTRLQLAGVNVWESPGRPTWKRGKWGTAQEWSEGCQVRTIPFDEALLRRLAPDLAAVPRYTETYWGPGLCRDARLQLSVDGVPAAPRNGGQEAFGAGTAVLSWDGRELERWDLTRRVNLEVWCAGGRVVVRSRLGLRMHDLTTGTAGELLLPEGAQQEGM